MKFITELTDDTKQSYTLVTEDGLKISFSLRYLPTQSSWYFDLSYGDITIYSRKLVLAPNILRRYKNILPFGLGCCSNDLVDPFLLTDFSSGRVQLYLLTSTEVEKIETSIYE